MPHILCSIRTIHGKSNDMALYGFEANKLILPCWHIIVSRSNVYTDAYDLPYFSMRLIPWLLVFLRHVTGQAFHKYDAYHGFSDNWKVMVWLFNGWGRRRDRHLLQKCCIDIADDDGRKSNRQIFLLLNATGATQFPPAQPGERRPRRSTTSLPDAKVSFFWSFSLCCYVCPFLLD
jgi:hypothetical protein